MKPQFKIEGREATPAEYAQLMEALLASQAATPTARALTSETINASVSSILDALFPEAGADASRGKDSDRPVYPRVSGFLEARNPISSPSAAPSKAARGRYE
jgi:hypothetical protein